MPKIWILMIAMGLASVNVAEAQKFLPFTNTAVSQEEYASAVETNNLTVLNVADVKEMVDAVNKLHPSLEIASPKELADYIRILSVRPCPQVEVNVARIERTKSIIDLKGISRQLREGEMCLYDNNLALWFASLSCGNFITSPAPVFTAMVLEEVPEEVTSRPIFDTGQRLVSDIEPAQTQRPEEGDESSFWHRHKKWMVPVAIGVGAGTGIALAIATRTRVTIHNRNIQQ